MWFPDIPPETLHPIMERVESAPHPRLFATEEDFRVLREKASTEGIHARMLARIKMLADSLLEVAPLERKMTGRRLLDVSRNAVYRVSTLALAWRMTGDPAYRERCRAEMLSLCGFDDWNPSHFLDVGEMTLAIATGYDWLYNDLSEEDRALIATAILEKGLRSGGPNDWWRRARNNWGQVCHTGMMAGALAVAELDPALCRAQMAESLQRISVPMEGYAPGGNYPEGPSYWNYGTGYNVLGLAMLQSACGTDFGLSKAPGFEQTGFYCDLLYGPSGLPFSYSDCGSSRVQTKASRSSYGIPWWFAQHFRNPAYVERSERAILEAWCSNTKAPTQPERDNGWFRAFSFFWLFEPGEIPSAKDDVPLLWNPQGSVPIAIARTSWEDPMATYVGLKCGSPSAPHGHMDEGTFLLDSFGERWFSDLGSEGYNRIEQMGLSLWNSAQESDRWKLFRLNNFGHNTLTLDNQLQFAKGSVTIVSATHNDAGISTLVADLSGVYPDACSKALRTLTLYPDGTVLVLDQLEGLRPGTLVSWRACTAQKIELVERDRVLLNGTYAKLEIRSESDAATWSVHDLLDPKPTYEGNSQNPGVSQLRLETLAPPSGSLTLSVLIKAMEK